MVSESVEPFDFVFLDAEKSGYADYLEWVLRLSRPGTILIADNVVRGGDVVDSDSEDSNVQGVREFNTRVAADPRIHAPILQTVGAKGTMACFSRSSDDSAAWCEALKAFAAGPFCLRGPPRWKHRSARPKPRTLGGLRL